MSAPTASVVTPQRVAYSRAARFNPITGLTPEILTSYLDQFECGNLRYAALLWEAMQQRDDVLKAVAAKRFKSVSRLRWEIESEDDSPEAARDAEILRGFYQRLSCVHALDSSARGGVPFLIRTMMDAHAKRYAVHEIVWRETPAGPAAEFRFCPLWFFECRTGELRFLPSDYAQSGEPLQKGRWLVTYGDGLMVASSIAYLLKHLPLKDWLIYSERHGTPAIQGKTGAAQGSTEWDAMVDAVNNIAVDFACVTGLNDVIQAVDLAQKGELPQPALVERMDRALIVLWRGGDLGTLSGQAATPGTGASVQGGESDILLEDDAALISEHLNEQVDRAVIQLATGRDAPRAWFRLVIPPRASANDLEIDRFLLSAGAKLTLQDAAFRYGRTLAPDGATDLMAAPASSPGAPGAPFPAGRPGSLPGAPVSFQANAAPPPAPRADPEALGPLLAQARLRLAAAQQSSLEPLARRLQALYAAVSGEEWSPGAAAEAARALQADLPNLIPPSADAATAKVLEETMSAAILSALSGGAP